MPSVWHIARREIGSIFSSLAALIFIAVFLGVCLFVFFWVETFFARNIADVRPLFEWMPLLLIFLVSALTMRMWSEERRSGTLEVLLTSPVSPVQLVLGKFVACMVLTAVALALTLPLPVTVSQLGPLDWGPVIGGYIATLCLAAAYVSIGLFVSARTDNQIVSLIVTALVCGAFYLVGSNALTSLFGNEGSEILRLIGSGSRFESITRGVIDLRDLYYYASILGVFLVLNVYALERLRWSAEGREAKHFRWRMAAGLLIANLLVANAWLQQVGWVRADLTEGRIFSVSETTRNYLHQLQEPLLIRGYFSAQTHPLLAPLVPRLRDLIKEYEVAGGGRVHVEFVDPVTSPEVEEEANQHYNIKPVAFQTASKYQTAVTNSYFDVLVQYGDQFETLSYEDLIEVKAADRSDLEVELRNPEYDITRAIKKVLYAYRGGADLFDSIPDPVTLTAYVSDEASLPEPLPQLRHDLDEVIDEIKDESGGKFTAEIVDPDAGGGEVARSLRDRYGLRPLSVGIFDTQSFWFHLLLQSGDQIIQVALPSDLDKESLRQSLEASLKHLAPGALRTVALSVPPPPSPAMAQYGMAQSGPTFRVLADRLGSDAFVSLADLADGRVPEAADILFVVAPEKLDDKKVFAIDQFLMKGGTVVLASSPFTASLESRIAVRKTESGLEDWLSHNGLTIDETMVLDPESTVLAVPVQRDVGGVQVREFHMLSYPYFADIRDDRLAGGNAPTAGLGQLSMPWASPIEIDDGAMANRHVMRLAVSSDQSWTSDSTDVLPDYLTHEKLGFAKGDDPASRLMAAVVEGEFTSYFADRPSPLLEQPEDQGADQGASAGDGGGEPAAGDTSKPVVSGVIEKSPDSARLILIASNSLFSDKVLDLVSSASHSQYLAPMTLAQNIVDWSLEDRGLLELRNRTGQFARTLEPLDRQQQMIWEYANYAFACLGIALVFGVRRFSDRRSAHRYQRYLQMQGT